MSINKRSKKEDLIKYAREHLGLNPSEESTREELFALIESEGGEILGHDHSSEVAPSAVSDLEALCRTKVRIMLNEKENDNSGQITLNNPLDGQLMTILRGVEVNVPYPVYDILKNAITIDIKQVGKEFVERKIQTEPFQVIKFDVKDSDYPHDAA